MDASQALFRWIHIVAGIIWIGHPLLLQLRERRPSRARSTAPRSRRWCPQLMPRALYWFRWGAAWTWVTGVLLLLLVFYHGQLVFDGRTAVERAAHSS